MDARGPWWGRWCRHQPRYLKTLSPRCTPALQEQLSSLCTNILLPCLQNNESGFISLLLKSGTQLGWGETHGGKGKGEERVCVGGTGKALCVGWDDRKRNPLPSENLPNFTSSGAYCTFPELKDGPPVVQNIKTVITVPIRSYRKNTKWTAWP